MKYSERKISQCILPLGTPFLQNTSVRLLPLLDKMQNAKKMKTRESKEKKFEK